MKSIKISQLVLLGAISLFLLDFAGTFAGTAYAECIKVPAPGIVQPDGSVKPDPNAVSSTVCSPTDTVTPPSGSGSGGTPPASAPIVSVCPIKKVNGKDVEQKNPDGSCMIPTDCNKMEGSELNPGNCQILSRLLQITNVMSGLVATVIVAMIIIGGIQYSAAGGDPQKVSNAKKRIYNAVFAFFAYIFMYSFLQWIVPGGILNK